MSAYTEAVKRGLGVLEAVSVGLCPGCSECASNYGMDVREFNAMYESGELSEEGVFLWSSCECCDASLGGERYSAHGIIPGPRGSLAFGRGGSKARLVHFEVCVDCYVYLANGDEPEEWDNE